MFADYNDELARGFLEWSPRASSSLCCLWKSNELLGEDEALTAGGHHCAEARLLVAEDEHVFDPGEVLYQCGYFLAIHELEVAVVAEVATPPAVVGSWMRTWNCSALAKAPSTGLSMPMTQGFP